MPQNQGLAAAGYLEAYIRDKGNHCVWIAAMSAREPGLIYLRISGMPDGAEWVYTVDGDQLTRAIQAALLGDSHWEPPHLKESEGA